VEDG
jgi:hypothetical protein